MLDNCSGTDLDQPAYEVSGDDQSKFPRIRVEFLLNYTKPSTDTLLDFFGTTSSSAVPTPLISASAGASPPFLNDLESLMRSPALPIHYEYMWDELSESQHFDPPAAPQSELQNRLEVLVTELKVTHQSLSRRNRGHVPDYTPELVGMLFTVDNLLEFKRLYFDNWQPNCPILHQSSFNLESASLPLLLAVFLIGATYSSPRDTAGMAREYFDLGEEFAFEHEDFRAIFLNETPQSGTPESKTIEALQATFLIAVLQNWQNGILPRRRMRTKRYSEIVSAARLLGLTSTKNQLLRREDFESESFNWNEYFKAEARIRCVNFPSRLKNQNLTSQAYVLHLPR